MAHPETRRTLGVLLIILGLLSFSLEFGLFDISEEIVVAGIFFAGGVLLISSFFATRKYWKLVCGSFLIFISIPIFNSVYELFDDDLLGAIFLWWLGGSILLVYIRDRGQWWAIIPAGLFGSLGFLAAAETYGLAGDEALGAILFFGLAATFGYLYLIRNGRTGLHCFAWSLPGSFWHLHRGTSCLKAGRPSRFSLS